MASNRTGAEQFLQLADQYATAGNIRMEALCHYQRARHLGPGRATAAQIRTQDINEVRKERAAEYELAATLFDDAGLVKEAGQSWYRAAYEYNWLGMIIPEYREKCYDTCNTASDRLMASEDWWGKGLAELLAGQALRKDAPASPPDPRNLPILQRAAQSLTRAGRPVEAAGALMTVAIELTRSGSDEEWITAAVDALKNYEDARPELQMPQDREINDRTIISNGVRVLTSKACRNADVITDHPLWAELVWLLVEAPKARSFQDQHLQNEAWNSLVANDNALSNLIKIKEQTERETASLERQVGAVLVAELSEDRINSKEQELQGKRDDLNQIQRDIRARFERLAHESPERTEIVSSSPVSASEMQSVLHPGEAYLSYRWNDGAPLRTLVTRMSYSAGLTQGVFSQFARQATAAALAGRTLLDTDPADAARLIGHIPDSVDTLIISPDSLLLGIPWHQLSAPIPTDPSATLGDRFTISITPAAGVLSHLRSEHFKHGPIARDAAYMGVACSGINEKPLKFVDGEVEAIKRNYFADDSQSMCLATADCLRFLETGCNVSLLHLACHAERNGLLLSQNGVWTTPVDLLNLSGRAFGADILLLTGCYAGDFSREEDNEFLGILRQLIVITGARAAVASVAPVRDPAGPLFADMLVSALTGASPDRPWQTPERPLALGSAVRWARETMSGLNPVPDGVKSLIPGCERPTPWHPAWWSPWFVIGDPSATLSR
ncbi:CHAT domain-containing protein [Streptomyces stelliscabiei]|uniref:CHAT domain-containing protein n=1 Tax=Streptomyces stelliscabiei TaxID=146820 RepID=UPI0029A6EF7C|nr:CHAT domain-containing protein [Streptomyces stelliscabiei]MDX2514609.1 CHAT domain-containing protein [Streptomyces stelliscabiei]